MHLRLFHVVIRFKIGFFFKEFRNDSLQHCNMIILPDCYLDWNILLFEYFSWSFYGYPVKRWETVFCWLLFNVFSFKGFIGKERKTFQGNERLRVFHYLCIWIIFFEVFFKGFLLFLIFISGPFTLFLNLKIILLPSVCRFFCDDIVLQLRFITEKSF